MRSLPLTKSRPSSISLLPWRLLRLESLSAAMRNVIVTGGSRGLGLGIACRLACEGFRVIAVARKKSSELTAAVVEQKRSPGSFHFAPFDLAEIEGIADLVKKLRKEFGPIYGLVNNAGMSAEGSLAHDARLSEWSRWCV